MVRTGSESGGGSQAKPPHRTQAQRRAATSARLLEAAIESLVERGYAASTTDDICRRAGVSQGALFKHYPTKAALLIAAVEHLYRHLREAFRQQLVRAEQDRSRVRAALEVLWGIFERPEVAASLELHMAARTNPALRAQLTPIADEHHARIMEQARELFPEAWGTNPRFETYIGVALSVMQGDAIGNLARPRSDSHGEMLDALELLAKSQLEG